jgi:hypothetical protein
MSDENVNTRPTALFNTFFFADLTTVTSRGWI